MRFFLSLVLALSLFAAPALAEDEYVTHKAGYWSVGRGDADSRLCSASLEIEDKALFMMIAVGGDLSVSVGTKRPMRRGKSAVFSTEAYSFRFDADYNDRGDILSFDGVMSDRAIAALRLARDVGVFVDGRKVMSAQVADTGLEEALDAVVACSNGQGGWWGRGVASQAAATETEPGGVFNREGYWKVSANPKEESCTAVAQIRDDLYMVLVGAGDGISFGVSTGKTLRPGRKGVFQTEAYSFDFEPSYDDNYLYLDDALNNQALAALRLARSLHIAVDGRTIASMKLDGSGVDGVLDALAGCAAGQDGWWGEGVRAANDEAAPGAQERSAGGSGTGFFISADGYALTAAHVVQNCRKVESPRWGAVKVLASDPRADVAILKLATGSGQSLALRSRGPRLGEAVTAGGYPLAGILGSGLKITTGVVSGLSGLEGDRGFFQISAPIQPGNSGGPVIDAGGALVGLAAAKLNELALVKATGTFPQNVNFAVPVTVLHAFLEENGVAYGTASAKAAAPLTAVTFNLLCTP